MSPDTTKPTFAKWGYDVKIEPRVAIDPPGYEQRLPRSPPSTKVPEPDAAIRTRCVAVTADHLLIVWAEIAIGFWLFITRAAFLTEILVACALPYVYFVWFEARTGQTIGKRWCGVEVVHCDGSPLTLRGALIRNAVRLVDGLPTFYAVGLLSMLSSGPARRQRLGDRAADTIVVFRRPPAVESKGSGILIPLGIILAIVSSLGIGPRLLQFL